MGEILRSLRKETKRTQTEVAEYLGMKQGGYQKYEVGLIEPGIEVLTKLADLYHVTIDYLVGRKTAGDIGYLSEQDRAFLKLYGQLDEIGKIKTSAYVAGLLTVQS